MTTIEALLTMLNVSQYQLAYNSCPTQEDKDRFAKVYSEALEKCNDTK